VSLTQTESPPRTLRSRRTRLAMTSLLLLCLSGLLATSSGSPSTPELEVFPKHFLLHPGEQIHYNVLERPNKGSRPLTPARLSWGLDAPMLSSPPRTLKSCG